MPISGFSPSITFAENVVNGAPQLLDSDVTFTSSTSLNGGRLLLSGLRAEDRVSILTQGNSAGQIGFAGSTVSYGGAAIGVASGGTGSTFTVTFNANVTEAAVDALIQRLSYANVSDTPTATRTLTLDVVDGAGKGLGTLTALTGVVNPLNGLTAGAASAPRFVDLDGDGDLDLVSGAQNGTMLAWRNTGTSAGPVFTPLTGSANPFNGFDVGGNSTPAFIDLDGDGDSDLVSGEALGTILAWRNTGTAASPAFTPLTGGANPFNGFDIGEFSSPTFVDLDGDGDLDLVSGRYDGTFSSWRNTGTAAAPVFTATSGATNPLNGLDVGYGSTPAFVDLDGDGDLDLVSGEAYGTVLAWRNTGTAASPVFTPLTGTANPFDGLSTGTSSRPVFVDLEGDGDLDLVLGAQNGTFLTWRTDLPNIVVTVTAQNDAPSVTSAGSASFVENGTGVAYQATGSDPEGTTLGWTLGGTDAALFNINAASGAVTFKTVPNFEAPADSGGNNVYDITVTASDGALTSAVRAVAITVTNVNEAPSITSAATAGLAENGTGVAYQATASDPDAGTTLSWTLGGTDAGLFSINAASGAVTFKAAPNFEAPADSGGNNVYDITVTASDGALTSAARTVAITVTNVNEAPSVTSGGTASFAENGTGTAYQATGSDPDAGTTLSWSLGGTDAALFNINAASGAVTFKTAPNFELPTDSGGNNVYDITVTASDGALTSGARAVAVTVTNVIEGPQLTGLLGNITFAENLVNATPLLLDADVAFTSETSLSGGRLVVTGLLAEDRISILNQGNGAGQIGFASGTVSYGGVAIGEASGGVGANFSVTFNANATATAADALIQRLAYGSASDAPTAVRNLTLNVLDGTSRSLGAGVGPLSAFTGTASPFNDISVSYVTRPYFGLVKSPSFLDLDGDGDLDLVSGELYGTILAWRNTGTATAPVLTPLTGSSNPFNGLDVGDRSSPAFADLDGDGDLDLVSGELYGTFLAWRNTGTASTPVFTQLVGGSNPFNGIDVGRLSSPVFVDLDGDNDLDLVSGENYGTILAWRNTGTSATPVYTQLTGTANPFAGINVGYQSKPAFVDLDGDSDLDLVVGSFSGSFFAWRNTGTAAAPTFTALTGSANPFDGLNPGFLSAPAFVDLDGDGDVDFVAGENTGTIQAWRNGTQPLPTVTVTVTAQNDAPSVTSAGTANFAENGTGVAYQATASDPDAGTTLSWTLGGTDAGVFNINAASGAVTFKTAPNFEAPADSGGNNVYDITVTASDGALTSAARAVAITVANVNEAPSVTSGGTASFAENGTGTAYQATGSDPDAGTTLSWSLGGTDAALFNINAASGVVTFKTAPNFEAPADSGGNNVYDITVTASDGILSSGARAVAITVTDVAEAVNLVGTSGADLLTGTTLNDTITGGAGNDTINAGAGDDILVWRNGDGDDTVALGSGNNTLDLQGWGGGAPVSGQASGLWTPTINGANASFIRSGGGSVTVTDWNSGSTTVICFYPGTMITTPKGQRAVETLAIGDPVLTREGEVRPVRWMGRQTVSTRFADPMRVLPIRIKADALGVGVPARDLLLSPEHAIIVQDVLVQAGALVNGSTITREARVPERFTYHHVELADHSLIMAENTPAETFVDNVDRLAFDNWDEHEALYGQLPGIVEMARPRAKSHRQVPRPLREYLAARATALADVSLRTYQRLVG